MGLECQRTTGTRGRLVRTGIPRASGHMGARSLYTRPIPSPPRTTSCCGGGVGGKSLYSYIILYGTYNIYYYSDIVRASRYIDVIIIIILYMHISTHTTKDLTLRTDCFHRP